LTVADETYILFIKINGGKKRMRKINEGEIALLFKAYPFIVAAYQFGSTTRGQEGPLSDLDIAILVDDERAPSDLELLRVELLLAYEIQKHLGISEVDLITLNRQRLPFQHAVLQTGRLIYEADSRYRIPFVQKVIQAYLDFKPTLELIGKFHTQGRMRRCGIQ
jgi:predicted nucleotidyltransferase